MQSILNAPITKLGVSEDNAKKVAESLSVQTVRDLATNEYFLLAQNCYLLAQADEKPDAAEKKHPFLELISTITGATVIFAALLYAAGWSYLYQYYRSFGIRISELNLSVNDALIYSLTVIFNDGWSVFWLVLIILIGSAILTIPAVSQKLLKPLAIGLFVIVILVFGFWLSRKGLRLGEAQAREDMKVEGVNLPNVRLHVLPEDATSKGETKGQKPNNDPGQNTQDVAAAMDKEFAEAGFRLLIHANENYYLFRPLDNTQGLPTSNIDIYVVPDSRVRTIHIQRGISPQTRSSK